MYNLSTTMSVRELPGMNFFGSGTGPCVAPGSLGKLVVHAYVHFSKILGAVLHQLFLFEVFEFGQYQSESACIWTFDLPD